MTVHEIPSLSTRTDHYAVVVERVVRMRAVVEIDATDYVGEDEGRRLVAKDAAIDEARTWSNYAFKPYKIEHEAIQSCVIAEDVEADDV